MGTCFYCKSLVPFNTSICVICENPIIPQLEPQASVKLQGKIHCPNCMTSNPANYKTCVACDFKIEHGKVNVSIYSDILNLKTHLFLNSHKLNSLKLGVWI